MKESHSKVLQQTIINLEKAYKGFFINGNGFPKFKSKKNVQSCRFPSDALSGVNGNRINIIKKLWDIHFKCSARDEIYLNKFQKNISSATLTKTKSGKYYLSVLIDKPVKALKEPKNEIIGIDLGINDFIVTSDNQRFKNLKLIRKNEKKLTKLHKQLSEKQKGSNNKNKARIKLAKAYEKINNIKENYLHEVTNLLLNENQVIVMEDLNVSGMMKNKHLSKSIQELSLYHFKEMLTYKSEWYDRDLITIDRFFPSTKLCNCCNYRNNKLTLKDRNWVCPVCKTKHDRDYNAAINIKNEGKRIKKIRLSSPKFTLVDSPLMDDKERQVPLKSHDWLKQEKNVFH